MGYPPSAEWGTPRPGMGYPLSGPGMGYPPSGPGMGYSPHLDLGWGTSVWTGMGYPPHPDVRWGTPRKYEQTETITFPHPSDADGKYYFMLWRPKVRLKTTRGQIEMSIRKLRISLKLQLRQGIFGGHLWPVVMLLTILDGGHYEK